MPGFLGVYLMVLRISIHGEKKRLWSCRHDDERPLVLVLQVVNKSPPPPPTHHRLVSLQMQSSYQRTCPVFLSPGPPFSSHPVPERQKRNKIFHHDLPVVASRFQAYDIIVAAAIYLQNQNSKHHTSSHRVPASKQRLSQGQATSLQWVMSDSRRFVCPENCLPPDRSQRRDPFLG
jgi:hypothetical protein